MRKFWLLLLALLLPSLAFAQDGGLSFTPPVGDISIVFLGYIFGIVDGVLHGSGSQILGQMFGVFNSAVLFLAGIVFSWILGRGVLDTAHEGEFLGRNKSSMWIPVRVAGATALLLPKASGYCVLQIGIMWLVVQGVGAADQVWNAALNYIARGGVIIAPAIGSGATYKAGGLGLSKASLDSFDAKVKVAGNILLSQICMNGLQLFINKSIRANEAFFNPQTQKPITIAGQKTPPLPPIVSNIKRPPTPVPDFIASVNIGGGAAGGGPTHTGKSYYQNMPSFLTGEYYSALNGICGTLQWSYTQICTATVTTDCTPVPSFLLNDPNGAAVMKQVEDARTIAVQQMYLDLAPTARAIVMNIVTNWRNMDNALPLGILGTQNVQATKDDVASIVSWVVPPASTGPTLLEGSELYNAAMDYFAIMRPNLNLMAEAGTVNAEGSFIPLAQERGWIMAGTYFFNLAGLNQSVSDLGSEPTSSVSVTLCDFGGAFANCQSDTPSATRKPTNIITQLQTYATQAFKIKKTGPNPMLSNITVPGNDGTSVSINLPNYLIALLPNLAVVTLPSDDSLSSTFANQAFAISQYISDAEKYRPGRAARQLAPAATVHLTHIDAKAAIPALGCNIGGFMHLPQKICGVIGGMIITTMLMIATQGLAAVLIYANLLFNLLADIPKHFLQEYIQKSAVGHGNPVLNLALLGTYFINSAFDLFSIAMTGALVGALASSGIIIAVLMVIGPFLFLLISACLALPFPFLAPPAPPDLSAALYVP